MGNRRLWQVPEEDGQVLCGEPGLEWREGSRGKAPQQAGAIVMVSSPPEATELDLGGVMHQLGDLEQVG